MQTDHLGGPVLLCMVPGTGQDTCLCFMLCGFFLDQEIWLRDHPY